MVKEIWDRDMEVRVLNSDIDYKNYDQNDIKKYRILCPVTECQCLY